MKHCELAKLDVRKSGRKRLEKTGDKTQDRLREYWRKHQNKSRAARKGIPEEELKELRKHEDEGMEEADWETEEDVQV